MRIAQLPEYSILLQHRTYLKHRQNQVSVQYSTPPVQHVPKKITLTKKFGFMITLAGIIELVSGMPVFGFLL